MTSKRVVEVYCLKSTCNTSILSCQGERTTFSVACLAAAQSISRATIKALLRWASIKATNPVPVPMSSILWAFLTLDHAPSSTPSVPTFIAHLSCHTVNCLNWKYGFGILLISYGNCQK